MAYRHPRIPLSRERKMRAFWTRSFKPASEMDRLLAETHPNPGRSCLGGQVKTGNLWTGQKRQFPAETNEFYFVPSSVRKSVCTFVRQLRGPHFSTCA